ncbi:MAG: lipoyl synthase [Planctomycetota bacterium]
MSVTKRKFPAWLRKRLPRGEEIQEVRDILADCHLATVCQEARCPNRGECYAKGTATFMILGRVCTRNCTFCAVSSGDPSPESDDEPERVAEAAARMGLEHVVITSVTRDDLPDGGSEHFARVIRAIRARCEATVEVLTPDFEGREEDVDRVLEARPDVFNHNLETVPGLYPEVRPEADYGRSLQVLARASDSGLLTKSGLMLGLGETDSQVVEVMKDLRDVGCDGLTLGQYLRPNEDKHDVVSFIHPDRFEQYRERACDMGFSGVAAGPFVRSSYNAGQLAEELMERRCATDREKDN